MNIYVLKLKQEVEQGRGFLDYYDGFVIVAESAREARRIAAKHRTPVGETWRDVAFLYPSESTCLKLGDTGNQRIGKRYPRVQLESFVAA